MRDYEMMVVLLPTLEEDDLPPALEEVANSVARAGGEVAPPNITVPWGRRRLAYPIDDHREGFYALYTFELDPSRLPLVDRDLKLNETVLRYLLLRTDGVEEAPVNLEEEPTPTEAPALNGQTPEDGADAPAADAAIETEASAEAPDANAQTDDVEAVAEPAPDENGAPDDEER